MAIALKSPSRIEEAEWMTAADFFREAPEDRKAELINGVMVVPMPPLEIHERLFGFLFTLLRSYVEEFGLGEVRGSRTPVELGATIVPEPDLLFVAKSRVHMIQRKGILGAPDFVIEILSSGTVQLDRGDKFRAYESAGVRELWLIDPYGPSGTNFYQLQDGEFVSVVPDASGILRSIAIPGFWMDVMWFWPERDFVPVRKALAQIIE